MAIRGLREPGTNNRPPDVMPARKRNPKIARFLSWVVFSALVRSLLGQEARSRQTLAELTFTTPAYQKEALRLIIEEANGAASQLNLVETLPIMQSNLVEVYITSPRIAHGMKALGNITTTNYSYGVTMGNKLSFITKHFDDVMYRDFDQLRQQYLWPDRKSVV